MPTTDAPSEAAAAASDRELSRFDRDIRDRPVEPLSMTRWILFRGLLVLSLLAALTAFLPLLPVNWWWVRIGDYPRTQLLACYGTLAVLVGLFMPRRGAAAALGLLLGACAVQVVFIAPYLPLAPREVQDAERAGEAPAIRVMTVNVLQKNDRYEAVLDLVEEVDPDVLLLLEVDDRWLTELASLSEHFSRELLEPLSNTYGMAFYTKLPVERIELRHYVRDDIPSIVADVRLADDTLVRMYGVHPNPPRPGENTTKRDAELILVGDDVRKWDGPALVFGDMNDVGWSRTTNLFQEVSRTLDPRKGRGFYSTFDATSSWLRYPLDYLFHSDHFRLRRIERLPDIGSDHFPLVIDLSFEPEAQSSQDAPDLSGDDREDAAEAVEQAEQADGADSVGADEFRDAER